MNSSFDFDSSNDEILLNIPSPNNSYSFDFNSEDDEYLLQIQLTPIDTCVETPLNLNNSNDFIDDGLDEYFLTLSDPLKNFSPPSPLPGPSGLCYQPFNISYESSMNDPPESPFYLQPIIPPPELFDSSSSQAELASIFYDSPPTINLSNSTPIEREDSPPILDLALLSPIFPPFADENSTTDNEESSEYTLRTPSPPPLDNIEPRRLDYVVNSTMSTDTGVCLDFSLLEREEMIRKMEARLSEILNPNGDISFPSHADPSFEALRSEHMNMELLGDDEMIEYLNYIEGAVNNNSSSEVQIGAGAAELEEHIDPTFSLSPISFNFSSSSPNRSKRRISEDDNIENENKKKKIDESLNSTLLTFNLIKEIELPYNKRFHRRQWQSEYILEHNLSNIVDFLSISGEIDLFYHNFMSRFLDQAEPSDRLTVSISHPSLESSIYINFLRSNYNMNTFSERLASVTQSRKDLLTEGKIQINVRLIKDIGGARPRCNVREPLSASERSHRKKSVIVIKNSDNLCGLRAILLGKRLVDDFTPLTNENRNKWKNVCRSAHDGNKFRVDALKILKAINLDYTSKLRLSHLPLINNYLGNEYRILVVESSNFAKLYLSPPAPKLICLELHPDDNDSDVGHFNLITNIGAYRERYHVCIDCWHFSNDSSHRCANSCECCGFSPPCEPVKYPLEKITCNRCNREFQDIICLNNHRKNGMCDKKENCKRCGVELHIYRYHKCFEYHCSSCSKDYTVTPHYCYLSPLKKDTLVSQDNAAKAFVFYDIESVQKEVDGIIVHFPIYLAAEVVCDKCYFYDSRDKETVCDICGDFKIDFYGLDCVKEFLDYLFSVVAKNLSSKNGRVLVLAHNSQGYDGHFLYRDLFSRNLVDIKPILNGNKILKIDANNVRFIDSLSFFHQPLDSLPKTFGLDQSILAKGFFPHKFNTEENQNYVGCLPDIEYFSPNEMPLKKRNELLNWYNENRNSEWNLKKELTNYCKNDVRILRTCVMEYRHLLKKITGFDPLTRCFTIASVAMEIFRAKYLPDMYLAITPSSNYFSRNQSNSGKAWLDLVERKKKITLQREWKVGPYFVDGYNIERGEIYEFYGCYYHGCEKCFEDKFMINEVSNKCMGELFRDTMKKEKYLIDKGYKLFTIWNHEVKNILGDDKKYFDERKAYYKRRSTIGELKIKDAFFGGRTNNIKFVHNCKNDEKILYYDFTSLYPYVLKSQSFPVGHPKHITQDFDYSLNSYFGFVRCIILPPKNLFIPVLPLKSDDKKLVFALCSLCVRLQSQSKCPHSDEERALVGTWVTAELMLALEKGYKIVEIIEVYTYNRDIKSIFAPYVDLFLKIKQEASGYPSWVKSEDDKEKYIKLYKEKEGILLDSSQIVRNEGKRSIAKTKLNSLWGKFAIRLNQSKTVLAKDFAKYWEILNDPKLEVLEEYNPTENITILQYKYVNDEDDLSFSVRNLAIAAFVTAYGRIKLYELIDSIESVREGRVLYFDTDSVIFTHNSSDPQIPTGDFLGELTDELIGYGEGARCDRFVSLGPKNYGYQICLPNGYKKSTIKAKGIRLSSEAIETINLENMIMMANRFGEGDRVEFEIPQFRIKTTNHSHIVFSEYLKKVYRVVSDKRRLNGLSTLPYGYCQH